MSRTNNTVDLVAQNEILKAQEILEEKAAREWMSKWGFYLDFDKICIIEAQKMGYPKGDYIRMKMKRKPEKYDEDFIWEPVPSNNVPNTTTGFVGWRSGSDCSLEKFGPFYVSPRLTLPYEAPNNCIILG